MSQKQLPLIMQKSKDESCIIKDIKGTTYEIRIESILGFSKFIPDMPKIRRKEEMSYEQLYYNTFGTPIYEIHIPELSIKVDKITSERMQSICDTYNKSKNIAETTGL